MNSCGKISPKEFVAL